MPRAGPTPLISAPVNGMVSGIGLVAVHTFLIGSSVQSAHHYRRIPHAAVLCEEEKVDSPTEEKGPG
jgi:hypothetical protein